MNSTLAPSPLAERRVARRDERPAHRPLPHDPAAEQAVIGSILVAAETFDRVRPLIGADDFYIPSHRRAYEAICVLKAEGVRPDALLVSRRADVDLDDLLKWQSDTPSSATAVEYAKIVADRSHRRHALAYAAECTTAANDLGRPWTGLGTLGAGLPSPVDVDWWAELDTPAEPAEPLVVTRQTRRPVIPAEGFTIIYGGMATGKSWMALGAAVLVALQGRAAYLDYETSQAVAARRLRVLAGRPPENLRYGYVPDLARQGQAIIAWLLEADRRLVVIDSIGAAGGHTNDADEYVAWHRVAVAPFIESGIAVLGIDHDIRSKSGHRDRAQHGGIGTAAKGNQADLMYHTMQATWTSDQPGEARLIQRKDRHDHTGVPRDHVAAAFRISYDTAGGMDWDFHTADGPPPAERAAVDPDAIDDAVEAAIEENPGVQSRELRERLPHHRRHVDAAVTRLKAAGRIVRTEKDRTPEKPGTKTAKLHWIAGEEA